MPKLALSSRQQSARPATSARPSAQTGALAVTRGKQTARTYKGDIFHDQSLLRQEAMETSIPSHILRGVLHPEKYTDVDPPVRLLKEKLAEVMKNRGGAVSSLTQKFEAFDQGNGMVTRQQFLEVITGLTTVAGRWDLGLAALNEIDPDFSDAISYRDFLQGFSETYGVPMDESPDEQGAAGGGDDDLAAAEDPQELLQYLREKIRFGRLAFDPGLVKEAFAYAGSSEWTGDTAISPTELQLVLTSMGMGLDDQQIEAFMRLFPGDSEGLEPLQRLASFNQFAALAGLDGKAYGGATGRSEYDEPDIQFKLIPGLCLNPHYQPPPSLKTPGGTKVPRGTARMQNSWKEAQSAPVPGTARHTTRFQSNGAHRHNEAFQLMKLQYKLAHHKPRNGSSMSYLAKGSPAGMSFKQYNEATSWPPYAPGQGC